MTVFGGKLRRGALVALLLLGPILMIRASVKAPHEVSGFDRAVRRIGSPLEAGLSYSWRWASSFFERWVFQAQMLEQKEALERENIALRRFERDLAIIEEENVELRRLLGMRARVSEDLLTAQITGVEQSPFFRVVKVRLDQGRDMVEPGMAVLSADGVVGRIQRAYESFADVMLVTDPGSKVAVEVARTRAPGILVGATETGCELELAADDEVAKGDLIQTSGVDDLFPKGRPVGTVTAVERRNDKQVVSVLPAVRFDQLDAVFVVLAASPGDARPREGPRAGELDAAAGIQAAR